MAQVSPVHHVIGVKMDEEGDYDVTQVEHVLDRPQISCQAVMAPEQGLVEHEDYIHQDLEDNQLTYVDGSVVAQELNAWSLEPYGSYDTLNRFEYENSRDHSLVQTVPSLPGPTTPWLPRKCEQEQVKTQTVAREISVIKWATVTDDDEAVDSPGPDFDPGFEDHNMTEQTIYDEETPALDLAVPKRAATDVERSGSETDDGEAFPCRNENCTRTFRNYWGRRNHARVHKPRVRVCATCGKAFAYGYQLKRHQLMHTGEKPFQCPFEGCGKWFSLDYNLKSHVKNKHPGYKQITQPKVTEIHKPRTHVCATCGRVFTDKSRHKRHQLMHTGEKPFQCPFEGCGKRFSLNYNLKSHENTVHKHIAQSTDNADTGIHKPNVCATCDRVFTDQSKLKRHQLMHTGEKPFQCSFEGCGKRFSIKYNLKSHVESVHEGHKRIRVKSKKRLSSNSIV